MGVLRRRHQLRRSIVAVLVTSVVVIVYLSAVSARPDSGLRRDSDNSVVESEHFVSLSQGVLGPSRVSVAENDLGRVATYSVLGSADAGALEWSLAGRDAAYFTIDEPAGALRLRVEPEAPGLWPAAADFEVPRDMGGDNVYEVTVIASISDGTTARRAVEVTVTDADEAGEVSLSTARPRVGEPLTATLTDPDTVAPRSALSQPDMVGPQSDPSDPDMVRPQSDPSDPDMVGPQSDPSDLGAGSVDSALSDPDTGSVEWALTDPDMVGPSSGLGDLGAGAVEWVWERSAGRNNWVTIEGATGAVYVPRAADAGEHLRVTAFYGDRHSKAQTAVAALHSVVLADLLSELSVSTGDSMLSSVAVAGIETAPDGGDSSGGDSSGDGSTSGGSAPDGGGAAAVTDPVALAGWRLQRPGFDARTLHYSVGCADFDTMTLRFAAAEGASRLAVDGVAYANPGAGRPVAAQVEVGRDSDVVVSVTNGSGAETRYVVHCLATDTEPFTVQSSPGATEELLLVPRDTDLLILDSNGVVRHHIELAPEDARASFRFYPDCGGGEFCYSYTIRAPYPRHVILDEDLEIIDAEVYTVAPLTEVGTHDFRVLEDGSYLLLAFEPAVRDFSHLTFPDVNGDRFGPETESIDSAIQIVTPEGEPRLTWNSYDHMPLEDCTHHRFPPDNPRWGQINSIGVYNGEIVASFRGCNRVLGIDPVTGAVNWRLGPTNQDEPGFASPRLDPAPLDIVGDPQLQFCGQHAASVTADGRLLLYDNGANCSVNPWTGENLLRPDRTYSRAVEYQLDFESHEAVYVREHSLGGTADRIGWATGQVERLADGDWLISWGSNRQVAPPGPPYPVEDVASATLVDPATGEEKLTLLWHPTLPVQEIRLTAMPAWALARQPSPLKAVVSAHGVTASGDPVHGGGGLQTSTSDRFEVVVTFNQPVADFTADSPSLRARGATVAAVGAHTVAGAPANSYTVTLAPTGPTHDISFELETGRSCAAGGICTAAGTPLDVVDDLLTLGQHPGP